MQQRVFESEAYMVASLSSAISGTTAPEKQIIPSARRILAKSEHLQALIQRSSSYTTIAGESRLVWKPDIERIQRVVVKNARGHAFYEMGEPMMNDPASVWVGALEHLKGDERDRFESGWDSTGIWPEVGCRMMNRLATGSDLNQNGWVIVQENVYRYLTVQVGLMTVRTVLYNFLATEVVWEY
ncbi:hypothetical protein A4A58_03605 [Tardiphaga robiniae]|uniref:Uncharacterized protein n=2 Tax=Tardiphaga robiniae TaxID=943830 RepID=A0A164AYS1_9BRAD|nr:hypothetical protein A4A58_03605 [Tardiphaga robiniae]